MQLISLIFFSFNRALEAVAERACFAEGNVSAAATDADKRAHQSHGCHCAGADVGAESRAVSAAQRARMWLFFSFACAFVYVCRCVCMCVCVCVYVRLCVCVSVR